MDGEVDTRNADSRFSATSLCHWQRVVSQTLDRHFFGSRLSDADACGAAWTFGDVGWRGFVFFGGGDVVFAAIAPGFALRFGRGDWLRADLLDEGRDVGAAVGGDRLFVFGLGYPAIVDFGVSLGRIGDRNFASSRLVFCPMGALRSRFH